MNPRCADCVYSEVIVKQGESYTFLFPDGTDGERQYSSTVLLCRAMPPIVGQWPQVTEDDWCGQFDTGAESSDRDV